MSKTKGFFFFILSLVTILFMAAMLSLVFKFWPESVQSVLIWIFFGLSMLFLVITLVGIWSIAKNLDEMNEEKVVQSIMIAFASTAAAITVQIVAAVGFMM